MNPPSYSVVRPLGQGTSATVYLCTRKRPDPNSLTDVAVKAIPRPSKMDSDKVLLEVSILKRFAHPNVVRFVNLEWDLNYIYVVMEYCKLGSLKSYVLRQPKKRLAEQEARGFLRQLASGLFFLWTRNLVHRDLKTENLLLTGDPRSPDLRIADFGIAHIDERDAGDRNDRKAVMTRRAGTLQYIAPEILTRETYDSRCDLWSVGVIFFEMLVGQTPFHNAQSQDHLLALITSTSPDRLALPASLASATTPPANDLLSSLLTRDPDRRITFQDFFRHTYIDLEHLPSADSLDRAAQVLAIAVKRDRDLLGRTPFAADARSTPPRGAVVPEGVQEIVEMYVDGAQHLLAYIQFATRAGEDAKGLEVVRDKSRKYVQRAEELKGYIQGYRPAVSASAGGVRESSASANRRPEPPPPSEPKSSSSSWQTDLLAVLSWVAASGVSTPAASDAPPPPTTQPRRPENVWGTVLDQSVMFLNRAKAHEDRGELAKALESYDNGIALLIRAMQTESDSVARAKLRAETEAWFDRAEGVKVKMERKRKIGRRVSSASAGSSGGLGGVGSRVAGNGRRIIDIPYPSSVLNNIENGSGGL
ncbi:kinase-like domain-containing protein [Cladochytrium replicatum]|nr:kinase-like domain-containing protein [Cladochytrium replicatum]